MTGRLRRLSVVPVVAAFAAGCQPLPQPFADDRPPADLVAVPDSIVVAVGTIEGEPKAAAAKLGDAIAKELLRHNVAATANSAGRASYTLDGRIVESAPLAGRATVRVVWQLRDASGHIVDQHSNNVTANARDWAVGADGPVRELASASGDILAALLTESTPKEQQTATGSGRVRVAVRKVDGAPGDGDKSLATSMAAVLRHADIDLVDPKNGKPDLDVDADVSVEPKAGQQHIKIVWHVSRANGGEIGTVAQENDLPRGRLDGPWGDIAYNVAIAAGDGIMQLVDRGAPPIKLGAVTPAPPPVPESEAAPAPVPALRPSPVATQALAPIGKPMGLAPGNIDSPEVNLPPIEVTPQAPPPIPTLSTPTLLPYRGVPLPQ